MSQFQCYHAPENFHAVPEEPPPPEWYSRLAVREHMKRERGNRRWAAAMAAKVEKGEMTYPEALRVIRKPQEPTKKKGRFPDNPREVALLLSEQFGKEQPVSIAREILGIVGMTSLEATG